MNTAKQTCCSRCTCVRMIHKSAIWDNVPPSLSSSSYQRGTKKLLTVNATPGSQSFKCWAHGVGSRCTCPNEIMTTFKAQTSESELTETVTWSLRQLWHVARATHPKTAATLCTEFSRTVAPTQLRATIPRACRCWVRRGGGGGEKYKGCRCSCCRCR